MRGAIIKTFGEPSDVLELANVEDALRGLPAWNGRGIDRRNKSVQRVQPPTRAGRPGGQRRERSGSRLGARRPDREGVQFDRHRSLQ